MHKYTNNPSFLAAAATVPPNQTGNYVVVDMYGRQSQYPTPSSQTTHNAYYPPPPQTSSNIEPPPPSYQDYSKDYRVNYVS